jgi:hypothetical protein
MLFKYNIQQKSKIIIKLLQNISHNFKKFRQRDI